jgi:hypothetical protein
MLSGAQLLEILDLLLQLDHLELTSDGQPLEPLEFGQPLGAFPLCPHLRGHVAGGDARDWRKPLHGCVS